MSYRDLVPFDEDDDDVVILRETLERLRDAYIAYELEHDNPRVLADRLSHWIEGVMEEAGMLETVRQAIQADWEECRKRREAEMQKPNPDEYLLMP